MRYENYKPEDYRFEVLRNNHETYFFVVSPKTILVAKPRDQKDHVTWLVEKGKYIEAIEYIEQNAKKLDDFRELLSNFCGENKKLKNGPSRKTKTKKRQAIFCLFLFIVVIFFGEPRAGIFF